MLKSTTPQVVRFSPLVSVHRSPTKGSSVFLPQGGTRTGTRFTPRSRLAVSREDDISAMYRELDGIEREDLHKSRKRDAMDEDNLLGWDEESTLVAMFEDKAMDVDEREELAALADQLKGPMNAQAQRMRQQLRGAIIPAIQQIKRVHDQMEDEVDMSFGNGVIVFDDACKRVEAKALRDEDELRSAYHQMKRNMERLTEQLKDAYHRRDLLWKEFEGDLEDCATTAQVAVQGIPSEVEDTIVMLERRIKNMDKKGNDIASKQKMLKGLLDKL